MTIRRARREDAPAIRHVFWTAVHTGAAGRYSPAELRDWVAEPAMPEDWPDWVEKPVMLVAEEEGRITGFMSVEPDGYLRMAFVLPDRMGTGLADRLYAALMDEARAMELTRLTVIASRYAQSFFRRHGWRLAPEITELGGHDLSKWTGDNPEARAMVLDRVPSG